MYIRDTRNNRFNEKRDIKKNLHDLYARREYREFLNLMAKYINKFGVPYDDERLYFMYGKACLNYGDVKVAQSVFEHLMFCGNNKSKILSRTELIRIYLSDRKTVYKAEKLAMISYNEALTLKDFDLACNYLAQVYSYRYDYQKAVDILKKAPDTINNYMIGIYSLNSHQYLEAEKSFLQSLEKSANHYQTNLHLGEVYLREKRYVDAEKQFKRCLELCPDKVAARIALGVLYSEMDKKVEARDELELALSMKATFKEKSRIYLELGKLYTKLEFYSKAESYYLEAIDCKSYKEAVYFALEDLYKKMGKNVEASKMHDIGISLGEWSAYDFLNDEAEKSLEDLKNARNTDGSPKVFKA